MHTRRFGKRATSANMVLGVCLLIVLVAFIGAAMEWWGKWTLLAVLIPLGIGIRVLVFLGKDD